MCGIAGYVETEQSVPTAPDVLEQMTRAIRHRGPDAHGIWCNGPVALGHRRLSIVDLSEAGQQPMSNETGNAWIVYNGEIFNHASLRPALERAGHRYRSHTDTETIVHSWEEYGPECLQQFRGMFAFALWDERAQSLFCARDRLGIKPFYYYWDKKVFVFASEIKALLEHPAVPCVFEDGVLAEYLSFGYTSSDQTMFRGIRKLMPGHWLRLQLDSKVPKLEIHRYWDVRAATDSGTPASEQDWIAECRRRLEETVRMRLMSDVPLGVFLSGGVDSSAIAALTKRFTNGEPVKTFSVGYQEAQYSELGYARQVAQSIGSDHREVVIGMDEFLDALPRLIWHEDEPISWPSSVSLYFVSRLAAEDVTVVLTGEGSDELFGGYERYRHYLLSQWILPFYRGIPGPIRQGLRNAIAKSNVVSGDLRRKLQHTVLGRCDSVESLFLDNFYGAFSGDALTHMLRQPAGADPYRSFHAYWDEGRPALERMLYADQKTYLVELLMKQDQMSMANSIESRVPFLDHTFVEFAAGVPDALKIRGSEQKYILKRAVEGLLPKEIIYRKKMGFPTPLRDWLRQPKAAPLLDMLTHSRGLVGEYLRPEAVQRLVDQHRAGLEDGTDRLWRLINLELWGRVFFEKGGTERQAFVAEGLSEVFQNPQRS
ncbi:MAG: asparagine synthase (glutamine-hydrolyzing) [Bryobacteraceae bacterium]